MNKNKNRGSWLWLVVQNTEHLALVLLSWLLHTHTQHTAHGWLVAGAAGGGGVGGVVRVWLAVVVVVVGLLA